MARRRGMGVFGLAFLDAMTCGLGAVVLLYMVINASVGLRTDRVTGDLLGEVDRLETEVLGGHKNLVALRNTKRELEEKTKIARGLSRRLINTLEDIRVELASYEEDNVARKAHLNKLENDLKTLEEDVKRRSASVGEDDTPGDRIRAFVGDGDRQYLTGLKLGGQRILVLLDTSASMYDETVVNVVRTRNLPDNEKIRAVKWRRAVATVDWIATQLPAGTTFQIYTFNEKAGPLLEDTAGEWLAGDDPAVVNETIAALRKVVPKGGTSLYHAFIAVKSIRPAPDNVILLTDGLPTRGSQAPKRRTISAKSRLDLFRRAANTLPSNLPVNVILFPMEGDPMAASAFWKLAIATQGSFISPSKDWP